MGCKPRTEGPVKMKKAYLVLQNGRIFEGKRFGADGDTVGELIFSTGVVGYMELLTKPAAAGQIIVGTFPVTGCYGTQSEDEQSDVTPAAFIVRSVCETPSNFRSEGTLTDWMQKKGIVGLCDIDTRALTAIIRDEGAQIAAVSDSADAALALIDGFKGLPVGAGCKEGYTVKAENEKFKVTLVDLGVEKYVINELTKLGCTVKVVPQNTAATEILADKPDGVFISDGPGDPTDNKDLLRVLAGLLGKVPVFAVGLGHLAAALALGGKLVTLKSGHHGANQPVAYLKGTRTYITTQHHRLAVDAESLRGKGMPLFVNRNDNTNEGMEYAVFNAMTVAFSPDKVTSHQDTGFLFKKFIEMMEG